MLHSVVFHGIKCCEWSATHLAAHGATLDEALEAIGNRPYINEPGEKDSRLIFSKTDSGRMLFLVAVEDSPGIAFIVTGREMTKQEKKQFRRRTRKKSDK